MIECYYKWCQFHEFAKHGYDSEPFCRLNTCVAARHEMELFAVLREQELEISQLKRQLESLEPNNEEE